VPTSGVYRFSSANSLWLMSAATVYFKRRNDAA
jgi:hypothetical protein